MVCPRIPFKVRRTIDEVELGILCEEDGEIDGDFLCVIDIGGKVNASPIFVFFRINMYRTKDPEQAEKMEAR